MSPRVMFEFASKFITVQKILSTNIFPVLSNLYLTKRVGEFIFNKRFIVDGEAKYRLLDGGIRQ